MFNNFHFYTSQYPSAPVYPFNLSIYAQQEASLLIAQLQKTIAEQRIIISNLITKTELSGQDMDTFTQDPSIQTKMEENSLQKFSSEETKNPASYTLDFGVKSSVDSSPPSDTVEERVVIRRNGFKTSSITTKRKKRIVDDHKKPPRNESELKEAVNEGGNGKGSNLSKAKHLWVNYGRRILDHAVGRIDAAMQYRLKPFIGKLNSKKEFEGAFQITETDSNGEKAFKKAFGEIAIDFVKNKASMTFKNSKYKEEMITQRHAVAAWIERLINA